VTGNQPLPEAIQLAPNYPNPFNAGTSIEYTIPQRAQIELAVHSLLGQRLVVLVDGRAEPGTHTVRWDGRRGDGVSLPSGIYFLRLTDGTSTVSRRLVLLKQ
jgi:flagellar hook assembly protein FlgD